MEGCECVVLSHTLGRAGDITEETISKQQFLASIRLQLIPAIRAATEIGLKPRVLALRSEMPDLLDKLGKPRICLVGKLSHPDRGLQQRIALANVAAVTRLKRRGTPVGLIYSDNIVEEETNSRSEMAKDLISMSDMLIVPSRAMEKNILSATSSGQKTRIVLDPWQVEEYPFRSPHADNELRLIWFGHGSNLPYLLQQLSGILQAPLIRSYRKVLTVLTDVESLKIVEAEIRRIQTSEEWVIRLIAWQHGDQPNQLNQELASAHIALLPSDEKDPRKNGVSHNRAVDAIRAGCITIGSRVESYMELSSAMLVGKDIVSMLRVAVNEYDTIAGRIRLRRRAELERFSPDVNLKAWQTALIDLSGMDAH